MVPLAMLSPPKFAYLSWRPWLFLMLADRIRRGERLGRNWPQAATFGNLGENRAGSQQTGQESPRSYMERRSKSSEGFIGGGTVSGDRVNGASERSSRMQKNNPSAAAQ